MNIPPNSQLARILKARAANHANTTKQQSAPTPKIPSPPSLQIAEIPYRLKRLEPTEPAKVINEDPVLDTLDAAAYLGLLPSRLEKWRQRDEGPIYLRYEDDSVRYELSELVVFRTAHRVRPTRQPHPGRR